MKAHVSGVMVVMLSLLAAPGSAEEVEPVGATRAETVRLRAELVLLRRIRSAQRELIEWTRVSEGGRVGGLPAEICEASALRNLCSRLDLTFSTREEAS